MRFKHFLIKRLRWIVLLPRYQQLILCLAIASIRSVIRILSTLFHIRFYHRPFVSLNFFCLLIPCGFINPILINKLVFTLI